MRYLFVLKIILELFTYVVLFWALQKLFDNQGSISFFIAFTIVTLINLLFGRLIRDTLRPFMEAPFIYRLNQKKFVFEKLIQQLVGSIQYQEIKKLLFASFKEVMPKVPHAFYIWENDYYYLSHYANIENAEHLPPSVKAEYFRQLVTEAAHFSLKDLAVPEHKFAAFNKAGITEFYTFPGHNQIFAFLLTGKQVKRLFNREPVRPVFEKVQTKAGLILENSGLFIDLEKKNFETKKLIEVSQKILSTLETKEILDFILDALSTLISYNAAIIFLLADDGQTLKSTSTRGYENSDPELLKLKVGQGAAGHVVQTKQIDVLQNVKNAKFYCEVRKQTKSQITVPLLFDGLVLGVICLESDTEDFFTENDIEILKMFANLAAIAIHNARQVEIRLAKQAFEHELINAATVQKGLLVTQLPRIKNLNITAENIPSKIVSGDLYDFIRLSANSLGIAIGDVSGKGAPAALMMTLVLAGFRAQTKTESTTCDVVNRLNDLLTLTTIEGKYTTFFYGIIRLDQNKIIYTNAGHNPPILIRKNGEIIYLKTGGIVLGFLENQNYKQEEIPFESGDILIAFTDGVTETMNNYEEEFGEDRIINIIRNNNHKTVFEIKEALKDALTDFSDQSLQADDLTLIIARHD